MPFSPVIKAGIFAFVLTLVAIGGWEIYLRSQSQKPDYNNDETLWTHKRQHIYGPKSSTTVFIGSSRNKYDLDQATWRNLTGDEPVQLAIEGSSPLPILYNIADDTAFKGKLVIDITEGLFFALGGPSFNLPTKSVAYYKNITPAQQASFHINHALESQLVFLDKEYNSLNVWLNKLPLPKRKGVFEMPDFLHDFGMVNFDRQNIMTQRFLTDTNMQNKIRGNWAFFASLPGPPPITGATLDSFNVEISKACNKITARGGTIIFVRTPSSGPYREGEEKAFPRKIYWDGLLAATKLPGIHFKDYPAIDHFQCPEFSHLSQADAIVFTTEIVRVLKQEKGWVFPRQ